MPKRAEVHCLYTICLQNIAKNIDYWTDHYERHVLKRSPQERKKILFLLGPFDELGTLVANDLLELLARQKKMTFPALQLLLNGKALTRINLEGCPKLVNDSVILSIVKFCLHLKHLNVSGCKRITSSTLCTLSTQLPFALSLNFSITAINIQSLLNIFQISTKLLELVVKGCKINDKALGEIAQMVSAGGEPLKLRSIDLSDAHGVTEIGLKHVLRIAPNLEECKHDLLLEAVVASSSFSENNCYLLRSLSCLGSDMVEHSTVDAIVHRCPFLRRLEIRLTKSLSTLELLKIASLEKLQELVIDGDTQNGNFASYRLKVKPMLEVCGKGLRMLALENLKDLDVVETLQLCPQLQELTVLQHSQLTGFKDNSIQPVLTPSALTSICIWSRIGDVSLTKTSLQCILSSVLAIQKLELVQVDNFTGSVLKDAFTVNQMKYLRMLSLKECNHIAGHDLSDLILQNNNLCTITLIKNWLINRSHYENWNKLLKLLNVDVQIQWE